jgi:hypothetical protein
MLAGLSYRGENAEKQLDAILDAEPMPVAIHIDRFPLDVLDHEVRLRSI